MALKWKVQKFSVPNQSIRNYICDLKRRFSKIKMNLNPTINY